MEDTINIFTRKREGFLKLRLHEALDWEKYFLMSVSHHSTAIEGSSLTSGESQLLLDEGITPKGKPFQHSQMEKDHYDAFLLVVEEAKKKVKVTPEFIKQVAAKVMHGTGKEYNVPAGRFDSSKGEYRKIGVFTGETSYPNFIKVEGMVDTLCKQLESRLDEAKSISAIHDLAFNFHFDLVSIHPFADGNGRVSRLMMNYILLYHNETPVIVHKEDRLEYIESLKESRKIKSTVPLRKFLYNQQVKFFEKQIEAKRSGGKDIYLSLLA